MLDAPHEILVAPAFGGESRADATIGQHCGEPPGKRRGARAGSALAGAEATSAWMARITVGRVPAMLDERGMGTPL